MSIEFSAEKHGSLAYLPIELFAKKEPKDSAAQKIVENIPFAPFYRATKGKRLRLLLRTNFGTL